ncbi:MAG: tyrosine-type recombinase/integrase [Methylocella sp.]
MADYHDAMGGIEPASPRHRMPAGSVAAAIALYLNSADFSGFAPATRADRLRILTSLARTDRGGLPFARMESQDVERLLAEKAAAPHAAKSLLKALRSVAKTAVKLAVIAKDPTTGAKVYAPTSKAGFKMWEESDIAQFEARWPVGSRERLAFALLLYTGQRRGDIIRIGPQHERGGCLELRQGKTGADVSIPVHPALRAILKASKGGHLAYLTTATGAPFSPGYFTNWFGSAVRAAGLPLGLSAHGLRKAMSRRLAEAGCTVHEILAISGHVSLKEVERYTKGVEQKRLANAAMERVCKPVSPDLQTEVQGLDNKGKENADVSLLWTSTSSTSPSASTARQR